MTPIPGPLLIAAGRSAALLQSVSLPAADLEAELKAGLEAASEAAADITDRSFGLSLLFDHFIP
jgi:hypothetical protein